MKKLIAKLVITLVILGGVPSFVLANSNSLTETIKEISMANTGDFRLNASSYQIHTVFLNRGYANILLKGDGDTDLDLYVYDDTGLIAKSECTCDYEKIPITIYRSGYFTIKVLNRGNVYNNYSLTVR